MATKDTGGQKHTTRPEEEVAEAEVAPETDERDEKLSQDVDSVLDEIDDVLEENSEDFVRQYVQKGGE